jgi:hypothetical protein
MSFLYILIVTICSRYDHILKSKKMTFYYTVLSRFPEIKNNLFTIRRAIKVCIDIINILFVYQQFCLLKKQTKVHTNLFLFDSERASGIILKSRQPMICFWKSSGGDILCTFLIA